MTITNIRQKDVRLISKVMGYKVIYRSRYNSILAGIIQTTYKMVVENE